MADETEDVNRDLQTWGILGDHGVGINPDEVAIAPGRLCQVVGLGLQHLFDSAADTDHLSVEVSVIRRLVSGWKVRVVSEGPWKGKTEEIDAEYLRPLSFTQSPALVDVEDETKDVTPNFFETNAPSLFEVKDPLGSADNETIPGGTADADSDDAIFSSNIPNSLWNADEYDLSITGKNLFASYPSDMQSGSGSTDLENGVFGGLGDDDTGYTADDDGLDEADAFSKKGIFGNVGERSSNVDEHQTNRTAPKSTESTDESGVISDTAVPPDSQWACTRCTYLNAAHDNICDICDADRSPASMPVESFNEADEENEDSSDEQVPQPVVRPGAGVYQELTTFSVNGRRTKADRGGHDADDMANSDEAQASDHHNTPENSCDDSNHHAMVTPPSKGYSRLHDGEDWRCSKCTLINKASYTRCDVCDAVNPHYAVQQQQDLRRRQKLHPVLSTSQRGKRRSASTRSHSDSEVVERDPQQVKRRTRRHNVIDSMKDFGSETAPLLGARGALHTGSGDAGDELDGRRRPWPPVDTVTRNPSKAPKLNLSGTSTATLRPLLHHNRLRKVMTERDVRLSYHIPGHSSWVECGRGKVWVDVVEILASNNEQSRTTLRLFFARGDTELCFDLSFDADASCYGASRMCVVCHDAAAPDRKELRNLAFRLRTPTDALLLKDAINNNFAEV